MPIPMTAAEVFDREFLEVRAKILDLAASLDRLDRAEGKLSEEPRLKRLMEALELLRTDPPSQGQGGRAEQVQLIFSRPYEEGWQSDFDMSSS